MGHLEESSYKMGDGGEDILGERLTFTMVRKPVTLVRKERVSERKGERE